MFVRAGAEEGSSTSEDLPSFEGIGEYDRIQVADVRVWDAM